MKKILYLTLAFLISLLCFNFSKSNAIANPWIDCGDDIYCASNKAGFNFPLRVENYSVRAMKDMIEINYPLDETRTVCVRKTATDEFSNNGDISGVYIEYPVNEDVTIQESVPIKVRGTGDKIYVMNMAASSGYYSAYCKDGMSLQEVEQIYEIIAEAETAELYSTN